MRKIKITILSIILALLPVLSYATYDISTGEYYSSRDVGERIYDVTFLANGSAFYVHTNTNIEQWNMSTNWDVTTASQTYSIATTGAYDIQISGTGGFLYIREGGPSIKKYTLTVPGDINIKTLHSTFIPVDTFYGYHVFEDGTEILTTDGTTLRRYYLSTPGDMSTAILDDSGTPSYNSYHIWSNEGREYFFSSRFSVNPTVRQYEYPDDLSSITYIDSYTHIGGSSNGLGFSSTGAYMYNITVGDGQDVFLYDSFSGSMGITPPDDFEDGKTCWDETFLEKTNTGIILSDLDVDNSDGGTSGYGSGGVRYPYYFYNDTNNFVISGHNIGMQPDPIDYSGTGAVDRLNMKNLTNSGILNFDTIGFLLNPIDYTQIQGFNLVSKEMIEYLKIFTDGDDFTFLILDKNQNPISADRYNSNELIFLEGLGYKELYIHLEPGALGTDYDISNMAIGTIYSEYIVHRICRKNDDGTLYKDEVEISEAQYNFDRDDSLHRDTGIDIELEGLFGTGALFLDFFFGTVASNSGGLDTTCEEIFNENGLFTYVNSGEASSFISSLSTGQAFTIGARWELDILDTNVIGWIYDIFDWLTVKLQIIFGYLVDNTFGLLLDIFGALRVPEREANYCFLGVNIYLKEHITTYHDYSTQDDIIIDGYNTIEYILLICMGFWVFLKFKKIKL